MYLKRFSSEEDCGEDIVALYLNIIELIFQPNRDIASNSLSVFSTNKNISNFSNIPKSFYFA